MPLFHTSMGGAIQTTSATGTLSTVASVAASTVLLAANAARKGVIITNQSTSPLYLALAATASSSAFTARLDPSDCYETPFNYTGVISGIWATANGNALITELT